MREDLVVPVEKLRRVFSPEDFHFKDTSQVEPAEGFIGQPKAIEALTLGLEINHREYNNIFATGYTGNGKKGTVLRAFVEKFAGKIKVAGKEDLSDICYIHNFENQDSPTILIFRRGFGKKFKREMGNLSKVIKKEISKLLRSDELAALTNTITGKCAESERALLDALEDQAKKAGLIFSQDQFGFHFGPASKSAGPGKPLQAMQDEELNGLPEKKKKSINEKMRSIKEVAQRVVKDIQDLRKEAEEKIKKLEEDSVWSFLDALFADISLEYADFPKVLDYFEGLKEYVLENINLFTAEENGRGQFSMEALAGQMKDVFLPFEVNLFVDNSKKSKPPVVFESQPDFANLFGKIEKKLGGPGMYFSDHTCLKAGAICLANGGYLILNIWDILINPGVWAKLKKTLRTGFLKIEDPLGQFGLAAVSLNPEPIPVKMKVIVVGEPALYYLLAQYDPDFLAVFKVKAEFDSEMPLTADNENSYASFISLCCREEHLLPFDPTGAVKILEYGARLAGNQAKLSTELDEVKDLIIESSYWADKDGSPLVQSRHVKKALEAKRLRLNLIEEKSRELIKNEIYLIDTEGQKVGQINGLSVYDCGDFLFGRPVRITARTFAGDKGLVSIQREAKMSGSIHNTGVLTLNGYFREKYGKYRPISFSASLSFEQCYSGIEGDSASAAELLCLISSLSGVPIGQNWAITGSVNQNGEIQPIGGVNEKIEGFFDICQERGLTGEQGVAIPSQNVQNLMLREDVVEACGQGKFQIRAIKTIDDGIEVLMGQSADAVYGKVKKRLDGMAQESKSSR